MQQLIDPLTSHQELLLWIAVGSAVVFAASLLSLPWLVGQIPEDYFVRTKRPNTVWQTQHPLIRFSALVIKNLVGYLLLLAGTLMLFLPGQGILTMVTALLLLDYPGKFAVERKVATTPTVLKGLNWLRAKVDKPPLQS